MHVASHGLFDALVDALDAEIEASITFSLASPPELREFLAELDPGLSLDWSGRSFHGHPALRERIVEAAGLGDACGPDDVVVTSGAAEANFLALASLLEPGDEVVVERPGWPQPLVLAPALGARVVEVTRREEEGWRLDLEELLAAIGPRTRAVFLSNPSNPTGQLLSEEEVRSLAAAVERADAWLLVDEVYAGLEWNGPRGVPASTVSARGVTTGSVSKALGLQGIRIGWLAGTDRGLLRRAIVLRESTSEIMNVMGEAIAEIALRPERMASALEQARVEGRTNLALLAEFAAGRPELDWHPPRGGLVGLARLAPAHDADVLARRLLQPPYRTLVVSGSAFGLPRHLRLGVGGGPAARLGLGLERLATLLDGDPATLAR